MLVRVDLQIAAKAVGDIVTEIRERKHGLYRSQKFSHIYHPHRASIRNAWTKPFALNPFEAEMNHSLSCPRRHSPRIATCDYACKAGATVGAAAALGGADAGATLGMVDGLVGSIFDGLAGAAMGALFGGAAGSAVGEQIDTHDRR
ncbi:hypothetical protein [Burkholderia ubonensis]|uniref:hypothetical protein n=1 Tax=Burkholderia ubonensis TaxID=101571 RepID=UPI000B03B12F|nr:hypothetical protein [Burkholderia ubonensis]